MDDVDEADRADLQMLLQAPDSGAISARPQSAIHAARAELSSRLNADISGHAQPALRVGQWTEFLTENLTFAVFTHPDRSAAFRVYEVVNTRGKDPTPTELIKSHPIGSSGDRTRNETYRRWNAIENQLETVGAVDQLTTFVRHVVTLERGYVIPRDLYDEVSSNYTGAEGVQRLLEILERFLPTYLQMIEPAADVESTEVRTRAFAIADELGAARFRPTLLAASTAANSDEIFPCILRILIPGSITGRFGSGNVEAQFARSARRAYKDGDWEVEIARLQDLKPTREEFELRLTRGVSRNQAHVLLSALFEGTALPELVGYPHQLRPRNGEHWPGFDADQYKEAGGLIANWVLTSVERRPQGSRTPGAVKAKLVDSLIDLDPRSEADVDSWTADRVKADSERFASQIAELWYGTD